MKFYALPVDRLIWNLVHTFSSDDNTIMYVQYHCKSKMAAATKWRITYIFSTPLIWVSNERAWLLEYSTPWKKIQIQDGRRHNMADYIFFSTPSIWISNERDWLVEYSTPWKNSKSKMAAVTKWRITLFFSIPSIWVSNERAWQVKNSTF